MLWTRASIASLVAVPLLACNFVPVPEGRLLNPDDADSAPVDASDAALGDSADTAVTDVSDTALEDAADAPIADTGDTTEPESGDVTAVDGGDSGTADDSEDPDGRADTCEPNGCGGCTALPLLGSACGPCSLDEYACNGTDAVACDGATACPVSAIGSPCTGDAECESGSCSEESDGVENDRCVPRLFRGTASQMDFSYVPSGSYTMGSPTGEVGSRGSDEEQLDEAQVMVRLTRPLAVMRTEVTQGHWKHATGATNPSSFDECGDLCPVESVDWYSAAAYANWLSNNDADPETSSCYEFAPSTCADEVTDWADGDTDCTGATFTGVTCTGYRLLTEAEWEHSARAGTSAATYWNGIAAQPTGGSLQSPYNCDPQPNLEPIAWYCRNASSTTRPVGGLFPNAWGLYDMLGNVWEWTTDWAAESPPGGVDPANSPVSGDRVVRGGSWFFGAGYLRAASRRGNVPSGQYFGTGFRVARSLPVGFALLPLGAVCAADAECASRSCSDESDGASNRRCVPRLFASSTAQMEFSYVPAGEFTMGSPADEIGIRGEDEAQVDVTLTRSIAVARTEITQAQWRRATEASTPSGFAECGETCPVESVDWYAAAAYANWLSDSDGDAATSPCYTLTPSWCADTVADWGDGDTDCTGSTFAGNGCTGYRLLTAAEWEWAARAGTTSAVYWNAAMSRATGGSLQSPVGCHPQPNLEPIAWYCQNSESMTREVAHLFPNAWGLYDMLGNVWEWTTDWYVESLPGGMNPLHESGSGLREFRGGSWNFGAGGARAAYRAWIDPSFRDNGIGFRVARTLP